MREGWRDRARASEGASEREREREKAAGTPAETRVPSRSFA